MVLVDFVQKTRRAIAWIIRAESKILFPNGHHVLIYNQNLVNVQINGLIIFTDNMDVLKDMWISCSHVTIFACEVLCISVVKTKSADIT